MVVLLTVTSPKEYPSREGVGCECQADRFPTVGSKERVAMVFFFRALNLKGYKGLHSNMIRLYFAVALSLGLKRDMWTLWAGSNWGPLPSNERVSDTWEKDREGGQLGGSKRPLLTRVPNLHIPFTKGKPL